MRTIQAAAGTLLLLALLPAAGLAQGAEAPGPGLSLAMTRTLDVTVEEGTWMSVDVSPDGRTLVFDLLGDLYRLPIEGGTAERITSGPGFDGMPRFSPDGEWIAFVSDRSGASNLWIARADGSEPRQLTRSRGYWMYYVSPVWAPDGSAILVSRSGGPAPSGLSNRRPAPFDLYLVGLEGGDGQRVTGGSPGGSFGGRGGEDHFGPQFATATTIWYSTAGEGAQLHTRDLVTGQVVRRTDRLGGAVRPTLSPDGRHLVYATRRDGETILLLQDLSTGEERRLLDGAQPDQMSSWPTRDLMPGMAFTPDGAGLVAAGGGRLWTIAIPSGEATPIPFRARLEVGLAASTQATYTLDDTLQVRRIRSPRLSPDGRQVAFVALDRIWLADLPQPPEPGGRVEARAPRRLTTLAQSEGSPAWSPDGRNLAFVTWNDSTGGSIRLAPATGGDGAPVTQLMAYYDRLAFTPDGQELLFTRSFRSDRFEHDEGFGGANNVPAELYRMPVRGGDAVLVEVMPSLSRPVPPSFGRPHFGPDPQRIMRYDAVADGLFGVGEEGAGRQRLLRASGTVWSGSGREPAHEILLSPDGRHAAVLGMGHAYLVTLPDGLPAPEVDLRGRGSGPYPVHRLSEVAADDLDWSPDGRWVLYTLGSTLFMHPVDRPDEPVRVEVRLAVPRDRPEGVMVLSGGRVITMRGDEVLERGDVVVRDNRIVAVGPMGSVAVPDGARVVDVTGSTVLPGYVDTHAHAGGVGWGVHRTEPWQYYVNLAYGVTSARDPQTMSFDAIDYADRVETGDIVGPRMFTTGRAFFASDEVASLDDARRVLRRNSEFFRTETIKLYVVGDRQRRQQYLQAALEQGLSPTSEGDANLLLNLTHAIDGFAGLEHNLPTFPIHEDVVQLVVASGATYTPALTVAYGSPSLQEYFLARHDMAGEVKLQRFWPASLLERRTASGQWRPDGSYTFVHFAADAARIARAGGRVAVGSHGNLQGIGFHFEMWGLALGGMTPAEVLRAATLVGAEAIGHGSHLGSIEAGKLADLQVVEGNPLDDIRATRNVRMVMKNGRLYDADTLDELHPGRVPLSRSQWWMSDERR